MKIKLLLTLFVLTSFAIQSQNNLTDSLLSVLKRTENKVEKLSLLNEISNAYKTSSGTKVITYGNKALELAVELNFKPQEGNAYVNLGNGNIILGNYDKAIDYFSKAKTVFEIALEENPTEEIKKSLARAYGSIGVVSSEQSNYSKAFEYYIKSITIYEEVQDVGMLSRLYNNVGVAYQSQNEFSKALGYFQKAKITQKQLKDQNIGITLTNIANCYLKLKQYDKALQYFFEAESHIKVNPRAQGEWNNSIGTYYKEKNDNSKALNYWDEAIVAFKSIDDKFGIADTYIFKSELFLEQNNTKKAIENAQLAFQLSKETDVLEQQRNAEYILSLAYEKQNNLIQALKHHKSYRVLQDSLSNARSIREGVQAEMNFEYEKKENTQRLEREKETVLLKQAQYIKVIEIIAIALIAFLLLVSGFIYYSLKEKEKRITLEKELIDFKQKALHLQMNPHFIFNCLGAISGFIINNGTDHAIKYLAKFSKLMRLTLEYSQESLIPIGKEIESLQNYLELEKLRFNDAFSFNINTNDTIEDDLALPPLLIQPIVENAIIHGIVTKKEKGDIQINFSIKNEMIECGIIDNGIGIDTSIQTKKESVQVHKSMALDIIDKRLSMITKTASKKASISMKQLNNELEHSLGTIVLIKLPIQYID